MVAATVAAVVLNWRDAELTMTCVRSLLREKEIGQIVVGDNESDGSLRTSVESLVSGANVTLIEMELNRGFAGGINPALMAALATGADHVFVINNDAVVEKGAIRLLLGMLEADSDLGMCGPVILNSDLTVQSRGAVLNPFTAGVRQLTSGDESPTYLSWAAVLVRSAVLKQVGLLDERFFMYWEDVDYSIRVQEGGWRIAVCQDARVVHELSASTKRAGDKVRAYYIASLVQFALMRRGAWLVGMPIRVCLIASKRLLHLDWRGGRSIVRGAAEGARLNRLRRA